MKKILTACTKDCPGSCSIIATVDDGEITSLNGNPDHTYTQGFLCSSTSKFLKDRFYNPQRILHPIIKKNGEWERISWGEALQIAADKISEIILEHGPESILYYQGFGARSALRILNRRFFNLLGGASTLYGTVCGGTGQAGQEMDLGERISHDPIDHLNSNLIIIWGRNPAVTDLHIWKIIKKARKNGAKVVTIDPVKTRTARASDIHYQPKPGNDSYLAMAMAKIILKEGLEDQEFIENHSENFDQYQKILNDYTLEELAVKCDIPLSELEILANIYLNGPSSIITGWGLHRYLKGHLIFRMIDALAAVSGNLGVSGGGVSQGFDEFGFFDDKWAAEELAPHHRKLPMPTIGQAILDAEPPIKLIFLTAGNPVAMCPNSMKVKKAFKSADFVIMVDQFLNDTSQTADLFLPATTFLEDQDLLGAYGHHIVSPLNPVADPQGECKSELWIFQQLANILGFGNDMAGNSQQWLEKLADPILKKGINLENLLEKPQRIPGPPVTPYSDKQFFTESRKFQFINEFEMNECNQYSEKNEFTQDNFSSKENDSKIENIRDSGDYSLRLLSIMPEKWVGSEIPDKEMVKGHLELKVHPQILESLGLKNGDLAILESKSGSLEVKISSDPDTRKDCVSTYRGGWIVHNKCVNVLTEDMISEKGNGTPYYETMVRIRKLSDN
ncbi:MAG: molybdopterin-dependent oxidoreductase [Methanobacteriaceae archaeon]|nr:molybdopterin-dependent oxidoreductase [Methanobacteriaceae archaeon]MDP2836569.1 molybdopterin-dependent oxidoreductase [Methanobacteriaceae archaeon]MDP3034922.1 molybdopterin-dependent oxidoreductase [Methanobacteriaceae archaeon]MDP3485568.1 molybdopterin-dependent oxidoreductase [Methanobacteriaceae archaeon]MDP3624630.1 molybdopterin-dependent oxidoreductase [Methanobacteriaceae archaeon]